MHEETDPSPFVQHAIRHLSKSRDWLGIVLRGHLLVEEVLREIVGGLVKYPAELDKANFTFYHWFALARSLVPVVANDWMWSFIADLNKLRNQLAHNVEVPDLPERIDRMIATYSDGPLTLPLSPHDRTVQLQGLLVFCCSMLHGYKEGAIISGMIWSAEKRVAERKLKELGIDIYQDVENAIREQEQQDDT